MRPLHPPPAGAKHSNATEMAVQSGDHEFALEDLNEHDRHKSTREDAEDMRRMGRTQELVRHFRMFSLVSFVAIATAAWELSLFSVTPALVDGGRANMLCAFLWSFVGFIPIYLSMAEMVSMAPICGAQYHWVSEFAPEKYQKILSYLTGWTSTLAWQAGNAQGVFLVGTLIQAIIAMNDLSYNPLNWQGTLLVFAFTGVAVGGNIFGSKILPYWQNTVFAFHILAYLGFLVPVWVNAPKVDSHTVWTKFENSGGWSSMALSVLIGQQPGILAQVGIDTAAHMSEEVKGAAKSIPKVMLADFLINFCCTFLTLVTLAYHIPSVQDALADPSLYPSVYVLRQAMDTKWLTVLLTVIIVLLIFSNLSYMAAVSRDLFAFARDQGLPFSDWISKVDKKRSIPTNACILSGGVAIVLSLIYIGSPVAFYAITSLNAVALTQCYGMSIGCVLWRRIRHPETLPYAAFSLGKWGVPINACAVAYAMWGFFWCFWPQTYPVTAAGFNWASPVFVGVIIIALLWYAFVGHKRYQGPVALVEGRKTHFA